MFYTDASKTVGFGGYSQQSWMHEKWNSSFIKEEDPSIEFLELYAVTVGVLLWIDRFKDKSIVLFCDNISTVHMINASSSSCRQCMKLIRIIVLQGLIHNVKIGAKHVKGLSNELADFLSRDKLESFHKTAKNRNMNFEKFSSPLPQDIWPVERLWAD